MRKKNIAILVSIIPLVLQAGQWDIRMQDNTFYNDIQRCWLVGATLFIVVDEDFIPLDATDVVFVREYRTEKSIFNFRRGWNYMQVGGIGGILVGAILGTRKNKGEEVQINNAVKSAISWGLWTGGAAFFYGGLFGPKETTRIDHDLTDYSPVKRIGIINRLLTPD